MQNERRWAFGVLLQDVRCGFNCGEYEWLVFCTIREGICAIASIVTNHKALVLS